MRNMGWNDPRKMSEIPGGETGKVGVVVDCHWP